MKKSISATAIITVLGLIFVLAYFWPISDPHEVEHHTTGEDSIKPEGEEQPIRVHDVEPDPALNVQEILNVRHRTIAVLEDGVAGLNYPDGSVGWIYRVPGHDTTVDITTNSVVTLTHPVPGRWFTEQTRETVLGTSTGEIIFQEDISSGANFDPALAHGDIRVFNDDTLRGQRRSSDSDEDLWEVHPASWCSDNSDPETNTAGDDSGTYLAIACSETEGHLAQIDPFSGDIQWEREFVPADGAPEILNIRNELRSGNEHDPTLPALDGEYGANHLYLNQVDGETAFPTELLETDENQIFGNKISVPATDPRAPVEAFIIDVSNTIEGHVFNNSVQRLIDWDLVEPNDLDPDIFKDPENHELHTPGTRLYHHDQQLYRLRDTLEEIIAQQSNSP